MNYLKLKPTEIYDWLFRDKKPKRHYKKRASVDRVRNGDGSYARKIRVYDIYAQDGDFYIIRK